MIYAINILSKLNFQNLNFSKLLLLKTRNHTPPYKYFCAIRCLANKVNISAVQRSYTSEEPHKDDIFQTGRKTNLRRPLAKMFVEMLPHKLQPFLQLMRVDRPIGSWLLFWPCAWSIALATPPGNFPDARILTIFALGSFIMRGAGCTINDIWDKDIDKKVSRTSCRPLATGAINLLDAFIFLGLQLGLGCVILLQLNWYSIVLGMSSLGLVILYPVMKRVTYWPQMMLGFTFNWGALLGWAAVRGGCDWSVVLPLYLAGISWTLIYDTIYAHQDKYDDIIIGVKSTALKFGHSTKSWLTAFSTVMFSSLLFTGLNMNEAWPYYLSLVSIGAHITNQIYSLKIDDEDDCARKFRSNHYVGLILFLGIFFGNWLRESDHSKQDQNQQLIKNFNGIESKKF